MKTIAIILGLFCGIVSCSTLGPVTGRPDPNVSTSGTLGSVKATDGMSPAVMSDKIARDSARRKTDSTIH